MPRWANRGLKITLRPHTPLKYMAVSSIELSRLSDQHEPHYNHITSAGTPPPPSVFFLREPLPPPYGRGVTLHVSTHTLSSDGRRLSRRQRRFSPLDPHMTHIPPAACTTVATTQGPQGRLLMTHTAAQAQSPRGQQCSTHPTCAAQRQSSTHHPLYVRARRPPLGPSSLPHALFVLTRPRGCASSRR
jgi:hypothetical protein